MNPKAERRRNQRKAAVRAVYREIPRIACKGLCGSACCGIIAMSPAEHEVLSQAGTIPRPIGAACPLLDSEGRCSRYLDRPLVCRVWYVAEDAQSCPYGCKPERVMTAGEVKLAVVKLFAIKPGSARSLHRVEDLSDSGEG